MGFLISFNLLKTFKKQRKFNNLNLKYHLKIKNSHKINEICRKVIFFNDLSTTFVIKSVVSFGSPGRYSVNVHFFIFQYFWPKIRGKIREKCKTFRETVKFSLKIRKTQKLLIIVTFLDFSGFANFFSVSGVPTHQISRAATPLKTIPDGPRFTPKKFFAGVIMKRKEGYIVHWARNVHC